MSKATDARNRGGYVDPSYDKTIRACQTIVDLTQTETSTALSSTLNRTLIVASSAAATAATCLALNISPGASTRGNVAAAATTLASFGMLSVLTNDFMKKYRGVAGRSMPLLSAAKLKEGYV